jgi:hypothetical protein
MKRVFFCFLAFSIAACGAARKGDSVAPLPESISDDAIDELSAPKTGGIPKSDITLILDSSDGQKIGLVTIGSRQVMVYATPENPEKFLPTPQCNVFAEYCRPPSEYGVDFPNLKLSAPQINTLIHICAKRLAIEIVNIMGNAHSECLLQPITAGLIENEQNAQPSSNI